MAHHQHPILSFVCSLVSQRCCANRRLVLQSEPVQELPTHGVGRLACCSSLQTQHMCVEAAADVYLLAGQLCGNTLRQALGYFGGQLGAAELAESSLSQVQVRNSRLYTTHLTGHSSPGRLVPQQVSLPAGVYACQYYVAMHDNRACICHIQRLWRLFGCLFNCTGVCHGYSAADPGSQPCLQPSALLAHAVCQVL